MIRPPSQDVNYGCPPGYALSLVRLPRLRVNRFAGVALSVILTGYQVSGRAMVNPGLRTASANFSCLMASLLAACSASLPLARGDEAPREEAQHWAFLPVRRPSVPRVRHPELV